MKPILLLIFFISSLSLIAQQFTQSNESQNGESLTLFVCDPSFSNYDILKNDGVTWDFSGVTSDSEETTKVLTVQENSNTDYSSSKVSSIPLFLDTYWGSTGSVKSSQGFIYYTNDGNVGDFEVRFNTDDERLIDYPSSLGASLTDDFSGTFINSSYAPNGAPCTGTITSEVDGKGTLILPGNITYTDVLRHKVIETTNTNITIFFNSYNVTVIRVQYDYYDLISSSLPLFSHIDISYDADIFSDQIVLVLSSVEPGTAISTASLNGLNELSNVRSFPNPVKNTFQLKGDIVGSSELHIIDPNGRDVLFYQSIDTDEEIDISELLPGIYYVRVLNKGASSVIKIIVE